MPARRTWYEHRSEPLLSRRAFLRRLANHGGLALAFVAGALLVGMLGYHGTENLDWIDSFLNAAMILSGMGQVSPLATDGGKLFAGSYALFSGLVVLVVTGLLAAPVLHRLLHRLHLDDERAEGGE